MKKVLGVAAFAVLGVVALSSCRKDYECVSNGVVVDTCTNCKSNGVIKAAFDSNCDYYGGTVQTK
jgi:hypothetical protein